jgi:hypothetical protein
MGPLLPAISGGDERLPSVGSKSERRSFSAVTTSISSNTPSRRSVLNAFRQIARNERNDSWKQAGYRIDPRRHFEKGMFVDIWA